MLATTAFSLIIHHDCSRSQAFIHARAVTRAGERLAFIAAHRCSCYRERFACVTLKYAPLLENASCVHRRPCLQQSLALVVALDACNSPVHTHRALFVPHRRSSYQAYKCIKQRAYIVRSSTLELENFLRSSLLIHAHARVRFACVTLKYAPLLENALRSSSRSCLQQPCAPCCAHSCTLLCTLIVLSSSLNPHRRIIVAHPIEFVALTALTLGLETEADLASLICGAKQLYTPTQRSC